MTDQASVSLNDGDKIESAFTALAGNTHSSTATDEAISLLASGSRQNPGVRQRLASRENLEHLTTVITRRISPIAVESAIRCIGNACADNDIGRDNISHIGFLWAHDCLESSSIDGNVKMVLSKALYNICTDHESAQQACYRDKIHYRLIQFCGSAYAQENEETGLVIDVIFYICGHKPSIDASLREGLPDDVLVQLLGLPKLYCESSDTDTYASLVESVLVFLRDPMVQKQIINSKNLHFCWELLQILVVGIASLSTEREEDAEDLKILTPLSTSLTWCLSDVAALPEFSGEYTLESPLVKQLIEIIKTEGVDTTLDADQEPSQLLLTAACQVVGNLLWALPSDTYKYLIEIDQLQRPCFHFMVHSRSDTASSETFHALAGLLIQLTRPSIAVRELIGAEDDCQAALSRLSEHEMPLIKQDAVKLIKVLGKDCPVNQERFGELAKGVLGSLQATDEQSQGSGAMISQ